MRRVATTSGLTREQLPDLEWHRGRLPRCFVHPKARLGDGFIFRFDSVSLSLAKVPRWIDWEEDDACPDGMYGTASCPAKNCTVFVVRRPVGIWHGWQPFEWRWCTPEESAKLKQQIDDYFAHRTRPPKRR